jgi:hypothetical protein
MDSTDSYAGLFLVDAEQAYLVSKDISKLRSLTPGISGALRAIEATQDQDGLTWAKPAWHVKYLMDQTEAYAGLRAAARLGQLLGDSNLTTRASADATKMKTGIDALWNPATGAYDWAVHDTGARTTTAWAYLYSDSLQQAWAVAFGVTDTSRGAALMSHFTSSHPQWAQPTASDLYSGGTTEAVSYWPMAAIALERSGDHAGAAAATTSIEQAATAANRAWPFTPALAGQLLLLETRSTGALVGA